MEEKCEAARRSLLAVETEKEGKQVKKDGSQSPQVKKEGI